MKTLKLFSTEAEALLGKQDLQEGVRYRMLSFCLAVPMAGEVCVCNLLTRRLITLTPEEYALLERGVEASDMDDTARALARDWFLVPEAHDDCQLCDELRFFWSTFNQPTGKYTNYSIMTTLDCNARCFYCYQMGRNRSRAHMSAETADAVADFIVRTAEKGKATLHWYGGEPLYNASVIDRISTALTARGIEFTADMITNGYLLDDAVAARIADWHLTGVQISLDGTEEVYNRAKAYIHKEDPSPYRRVLGNIERALDHGLNVNIRVNIDRHNDEDIFALAGELAARFAGRKKLWIYAAGLYENEGPNHPQRDAEERMRLTDSLIAFEEHCRALGLGISGRLGKTMRFNRCMADAPKTVTVSPEGKLGKCDHAMETDIFGDIRSDKTDAAMLALWREKRNTAEECAGCPVYTDCYRLKKCKDDGIETCDPAYRKWQLHQKTMQLRRVCEVLLAEEK